MVNRVSPVVFCLVATAGCDVVFGLSTEHPDGPADPDAAGSRYAEAVRADRPLGYWRFSAGALTAVDLVGDAPGVYAGDAAPTASGALLGEDDQAVALDGAGDYVDMGGRFGFPGTMAFTIEAWVNPRVNGLYNGVVAKNDESAGGNTRVGYHMYSQNSAFGFERSDGTLIQDVRTGALTTQRWTHVAVTFDGNTLSLYTDGVLRSTTPLPTVILPATNHAFVVGGRDGGRYLFLNGAVDELAIYGAALPVEKLAGHRLIGLGQ